jgi:T3SS negative regulator,GrlR
VNVNGLWTAEFSGGNGSGTGIVVLADGQILGGDTTYYYSGNFTEMGTQLKGNLDVVHYSGPLNNIFGRLRSIHLLFEGAVGDDLIMARGYDPAAPERNLSIRLRRVKST